MKKRNMAWLVVMALTVGMGLQPLNVEAAATIAYEQCNGYTFSPDVKRQLSGDWL